MQALVLRLNVINVVRDDLCWALNPRKQKADDHTHVELSAIERDELIEPFKLRYRFVEVLDDIVDAIVRFDDGVNACLRSL